MAAKKDVVLWLSVCLIAYAHSYRLYTGVSELLPTPGSYNSKYADI